MRLELIRFEETDGLRVMVVFLHRPRSAEIFIEMQETTYSRKLDSMGRIMIPSKLREQMGLVLGQEYLFFTHEENGHKYICIDCGNSALLEAMKLLEENGLKVVSEN